MWSEKYKIIIKDTKNMVRKTHEHILAKITIKYEVDVILTQILTVQQHTTNVVDAQLLHESRKDTRGEGRAEHLLELLVQPSDAHLLEVEVTLEQRVISRRTRTSHKHNVGLGARSLLPGDLGLSLQDLAAGRGLGSRGIVQRNVLEGLNR